MLLVGGEMLWRVVLKGREDLVDQREPRNASMRRWNLKENSRVDYSSVDQGFSTIGPIAVWDWTVLYRMDSSILISPF